MGHLVQHFRAHYCAVEKPIGEHSLLVMKRSIPSYGSLEILAKVVYSGICTTDLQILRGERGLEPIVLGHEAVCQVVEVGENVRGVSLGEVVLLNPNNPLDDYDKLGHNREGLFQEYIKFGQEFLDRKQVLTLGNSALSATYTMIEPLSGVIAAQDRIKDRIPRRNVLIVGAGVMGLLFALMNVKSGARNVFLANRSKGKLEFAISRGIVQEGKTFDSSRGISSPLLEVSAGEGADIVIVCVSRGQGAPVAQEALTYVNPGGCVYLFAGFCSGDLLTLDEGQKLDAWSIRTCWRTERVHIAGKTVDVSGHRGSRQEDLALAAHLIRSDTLYFSKVISHIISLQAVPETALALAMDENILGMPAKRVVVDMDARDRVVERAEELPFRHLYEAAGKPKAAVSMGNLFREIGFEGSTSTLGWANSPTWQDIQVALETALKVSALNSKRHIIWVGTGAWAFLVDALKEITPASRDITFHTLYSLDPQALATLFSLIEDLSMAVCLGISESGKTVETVTLMNTLRERFESAGLDHRHHFVWLTSTFKSELGNKSGEEVIRSSIGHDWKRVAMVPLTVQNQFSINALFCAPHSTAMFLPLILMLQKDWKTMQHMYQQYLASKDSIARNILSKAYFVASNHVDCLQVNLDESIAPTMARLVVQLIEQALGSKQDGFNQRVRVGSGTQVAPNGFELVALPVPIEIPAVVKLMVTMNALSVFVATVAYHRVIEFSTHPKVDLYKRRAAELVAAAEIEQKISDPRAISDEILAYVKHDSQLKCVQIICYGSPPVSCWRNTKWVASCLAQAAQHIAVEIIKGEDWNHSQYQAAVQRKDTLYVVLVLPEYCQHVEGISKEAIFGNIRMLRAIARATFETLRPKALIFRIREEFPSTDSR
jgi:threonine dehydrogenase-like Zn-dependent dehydrogenase